MSNASSKIVRSYDKSVSNRAPKQTKSRPTTNPAANVDPGAAKSTVAANTAASTSKGGAGSSKKPAGQKSKEAPSDRRVVFRSTLDTPFRVDWPTIPSPHIKAFLDKFIELLTHAEVAKFNASRGRHVGRGAGHSNKPKEADSTESADDAKSRKRKRKGKGRESGAPGEAALGPARKRQRVVEGDADAMVTDSMPPPEILSHLVIGVNHVTKRLEGQLDALSAAKRLIKPASSHAPTAAPKLRYVLVCTGDIDPAALVAHIPHLVAGCNSNSTEDTTLLVPLPKGAEALLASAFGLPRCSVVAIAESAPPNIMDPLVPLTSSFPIVRAPWLVVHAPENGAEAMDVDTAPTLPSRKLEHIPTHVKQVRTTAPRNMGAAKRARKEARAAVRAKLILHPTPEQLRNDMAGGKPVKKNRLVVVSLPEAEGTSS